MISIAYKLIRFSIMRVMRLILLKREAGGYRYPYPEFRRRAGNCGPNPDPLYIILELTKLTLKGNTHG